MTKFKLVRTRSWPGFLSYQTEQAISKESRERLACLVEQKTRLEQIRRSSKGSNINLVLFFSPL